MLTDLDYELLSAYIDGALTESERTAFELRLQAEPELSRELDELRATITLLNNLPLRKAPRDFTLDAPYARRTTSFFTTAAFSALSTAAAVILFALGAYLFTGSSALSPAASSGQVAQSAFVATSTADTLDKAAATTATQSLMLNEVAITDTPLNSPIIPGGLVGNDALVQVTPTAQSSQLPIQPPLFQDDNVQATGQTGEGFSSGGAPASVPPSDSQMQRRTDEATQTMPDQYYAAPSTDGSITGAAAPAPIQQTEANAASSLAATQLLFAATLLPTASPMPSSTLAPTFTSSPTMTNTVQPTETATPPPTLLPQVTRDVASAADSFPLLLVGLGVIFLLIAVATTLIRRRNRS